MEKKKKRKLRPILLIALLILLIWICCIVVPMLERRVYRLEYQETIAACSQAYGLDPYWVAAVIHCESSFVVDAKSNKGAMGLMQIMPATGTWIAEKLGMGDFETDQLNVPQINIECGCWYLSYLKDKYQGDIVLVLAAYNAGPGNVDKWLEDNELSSEGELQSIPYKETEKYVEKVQRAYQKYQELYPDCW